MYKSVFQTLEPGLKSYSIFKYIPILLLIVVMGLLSLGIIWHVIGYFVTRLRLCICDAAPCSNTLFKAVDTDQKIAFVSHKQYIQISLNTWTAYYSSESSYVLVYSEESKWTVSNSFLPLPWLSFQELCQFQLQVKYHFTITLPPF